MEAIVTIGIIFLIYYVFHLKGELHSERTPCEKCGSKGSTQPFSGLPENPPTYNPPLELCSDCSHAHFWFLTNRSLMETESRYHFGKPSLVNALKPEWGDKAIDMAALIMLAKENIDHARRVMSHEAFEEMRPWLEDVVQQMRQQSQNPGNPTGEAIQGDLF